jgi:hypothetical protein
VGHAHGPKAHDGTITTERPDQMWGMDATSCLTRREGTATVFVVVDHCAAECIGLHVAKPGTRFEAVEALRQGVHALFGGYETGIARGLLARHDHGSQYVSDYFQAELKFLGITSSPAFVREPEGNGVAERFIRTLKEQLLWVRTFEQLVVHRDLADLGPQPLDLVVPLVGGPALQRPLAPRQELLAPLRPRRRRHPELARHTVERLAPQQAQDRLRLPPRREAPGLAVAVTDPRRRAGQDLPRSLASAHGSLLGGPSCPPVRCPTKL